MQCLEHTLQAFFRPPTSPKVCHKLLLSIITPSTSFWIRRAFSEEAAQNFMHTESRVSSRQGTIETTQSWWRKFGFCETDLDIRQINRVAELRCSFYSKSRWSGFSQRIPEIHDKGLNYLTFDVFRSTRLRISTLMACWCSNATIITRCTHQQHARTNETITDEPVASAKTQAKRKQA